MPVQRKYLSRIVIVLVVLGVLGGGWWWKKGRGGDAEMRFRTAQIEQGDLRVTISATGSLSALSTVDVGSEVSGKVEEVLVDYNDRVVKGQIIARIEPDTFQAQIEQGNAAIANARASLATARASVRNTELDYGRKLALVERKLVARGDLDQAQAARDQARAQVAAAEAQIRQQTATADSAHLNLARSVIRAPVDGVVLARSVEPGQTVAASLQAPVLFKIAEDLARMEIVLAVDESDIGQVRQGQDVSFTVDAFPDRRFNGKVRQVRLSSTNTNNVITYPVVVTVDNSDQVLLPGMTANAEIEVTRRDNVLKVPNAALRFKPPVQDPAKMQLEGQQRGNGMSEELPKIAARLKLDAAQQVAFDDALAKMRERIAARTAAPPQGNAPPGLFGRGPGQQSRGGGGGEDAGAAMRQRRQERFNQQFGAFRTSLRDDQRKQWDEAVNELLSARRAPIYRLVDGQPQPVLVRVGTSDGSSTAIEGDLKPGDEVIVGVQVAEPTK